MQDEQGQVDTLWAVLLKELTWDFGGFWSNSADTGHGTWTSQGLTFMWIGLFLFLSVLFLPGHPTGNRFLFFKQAK